MYGLKIVVPEIGRRISMTYSKLRLVWQARILWPSGQSIGKLVGAVGIWLERGINMGRIMRNSEKYGGKAEEANRQGGGPNR